MTHRSRIYAYISSLLFSIALMLPETAGAQEKVFVEQDDSIPFFKGFAVSANLSGPAVRALSDYGEIEVALRINLHDEYFPIFEAGLGSADHDDEVTSIKYKTKAPYFRIGCDFNLLKRKHTGNRLYVGARYAFTSYDVDLARPAMTDPVWGTVTDFEMTGDKCSQHWAEIVFGVDAKVWGPLHLGWTVRYKSRLMHDDGEIGKTWYVPGYGKYGSSRIGGDFQVIIDI